MLVSSVHICGWDGAAACIVYLQRPIVHTVSIGCSLGLPLSLYVCNRSYMETYLVLHNSSKC